MKNDNSNQNPWAGLSSYEDPAKSEQKLKFCGRDNETKEVARLIDDNFFVTLYGKSGIGKTSLLNAGVFPALRREQYTPLNLRLGMTEETSSFQDVITQAIEHAIEEIGGSVRVINVMDEHEEKDATDYLWRWFARRRFLTANGQITFPVLVFDQFEEVFRHKDFRRKTKVLLEQLNYLIDESHAIGDCVVDGEEYNYDFNFRFVLSIREDDLYRLEDALDNCSLPALKYCRYRLRSLSEQGARDAILIPGEGLFREDEKEQIAQTIIGIARNRGDKSISTNLLSLVCNRLYVESQEAGSSNISLSLLDSFVKGNPFERFYNEATRGFSNKEKSYIEEHLVDSTGRRNSIPESDFLVHVKNGERLIDGKNRILQRVSTSSDGGSTRVELIHDSFCIPLEGQRQKRLQQKSIKQIVLISTLTLIILGGAACIIYFMYERQQRMLINQSRFLAEKATILVDEGDAYTARILALEALPKNLEHPDRPYTVEAEAALRKASDYNSGVFVGHTDIVNSVHYNSDENLIVSASSDKTIKVWDALTAKEIYTLNNQSKPVIEALFSPDGNRIFSAEEGGVIKIWDTKSKKCTHLLQRHNEEICNLSFDKEGKHFMSVSKNKIVVWNVKDGKVYNEIKPLKKTTKALFHPNGLDVVSLSDNVFYIWDISSASLKRTIECPIERYETLDRLKLDSYLTQLHSFAFSSNGNLIICSDNVGRIYFLDMEQGKVIESFFDERGTVDQFAIFNENKLILSATSGQSVITVRDRDGDQKRTLVGHKGEITSIETGPCSGRIISSSKDHTIRQWDLYAYIKSVNTEGDYDSSSTTLSNDFKFYAGADFNTADITIWNTKDGSCYKKMKGVYACQYLTFNSDNTLLAIVGQKEPNHFSLKDNMLKLKTYIFDVRRKKLHGIIDANDKMAFSPNNDRIACGVDSTVCIFDTKTSNLKKKLKGHSKGITAITYSPNGQYLASGSSDKTVRIWDVNTGNCMHVLYGHSEGITSVVYSPDGDIIISVSQDNTIKLWNPINGCLLYTLNGHTGEIESVNISRNGKWIVSTSSDKTIKVWDVQSGCLLNTIECEYVRYNSFFSSDDKSIISLCANNKMEIYGFPPLQQLIDETRERFKNRKLTPEERRKYYLE